MNIHIVDILLFLLTLILVIPISFFVIECIASLLPKKSPFSPKTQTHPRTTILVPAHNEEVSIKLVLEKVLQQLTPQDRLVVIADNCQDNTAEIARSTGAEVIERTHKTNRGKGYALDYGMNYIKDEPPEVLVVLDADSLISPQAIATITTIARDTQRPVQATYLMNQPDNPSLTDRVSIFALKVKNLVRILGLNRLGYHSLLTGSGMAFPWSIISQISLAGSKTTDDMQLTVDLALAGKTPIFTEEVLVMGRLMQDQAATSQRSRWEHGHLEMILVEVPRLLKTFLQQRRLALLVLALDISIPPLSLLVMLWLTITTMATLATIFGASSLPALMLGITGLGLLSALLLIWTKFGSEDLCLKDLTAIPFYILGKIPIYLKFLVNPQSRWLKTERDVQEHIV